MALRSRNAHARIVTQLESLPSASDPTLLRFDFSQDPKRWRLSTRLRMKGKPPRSIREAIAEWLEQQL